MEHNSDSMLKLRNMVQASVKFSQKLDSMQKSAAYVALTINSKPAAASLNTRKSVIQLPSTQMNQKVDPLNRLNHGDNQGKDSLIPPVEQLRKEFNIPERAINQCLVAFQRANYAKSGLLDKAQTHFALHQIGFMFTKEQVNQYFEEFDQSKDGNFNIREFLRMIEFHIRFSKEKKDVMSSDHIDENDVIDAFVSMGGNPDKSGSIQWKRISYVIKLFALSVDVMALMTLLDADDDGSVNYEEFARLFTDFEDNEDVQELLLTFRSGKDGLTPRGFF